MKDTNTSQKVIASDNHLKNIFVSDTYLEMGIIDIDVMKRLLDYKLINIDEIAYFPIQNKGIGRSNFHDETLKNYLPYHFFREIVDNNASIILYITYGLLQYYGLDHKETFMPIIMIPIKMYFENEELLVQMVSNPLENPMLYSVLNNFSKMTFMQNIDLTTIEKLDNFLFQFTKIEGLSVRPDSLLTYGKLKAQDIFLTYKNFIKPRTESSLGIDEVYRVDKNIYFSRVLNKEQRVFIERSINGENLKLTGFSGTGKTTVLKDIIVNNLYNNVKTLYVSNSIDSLDEMYKFLYNKKLDKYCVNLSDSFKKITDISYDDIYLEPIEEVNDLLKQVNEYYDMLENYESNMNYNLYDFKFVEIIKYFYEVNNVINSEDIDKFKNFFVNSEFIYKHEYEDIYQTLLNIEKNMNDIGSFTNSIWNAIPIVNNIKSSNQVLNVVNQLNEGLKKLRSSEVMLSRFGVKAISSFSEIKKYIEPLDVISASLIPDEWQTSIDVFEQAKNRYNDLKNDIIKFQETEYYLSTKYKGLNSINIKTEISLLFGSFYTKDNLDVILKILINKKEINEHSNNLLININNLKMVFKNISDLMKWDVLEKDDYLKELEALRVLFTDNYINGKMLNMVLNNKYNSEIIHLNDIYNSINDLDSDLNKLIKSNKNLNNIDFSKGNVSYSNEDIRTYDTKYKKIKKLAKEYFDICGESYKYNDVNINSILALKDYYNIIKQKTYRRILVDFIQGLDEDGYIEILTLLTIGYNSYQTVSEEISYFGKYLFDCEGLIFAQTIDKIDEYLLYLDELFESNVRLKNVVLNNEYPYVDPKEYYEIDEQLNNFNNIILYLHSNNEYKSLFGYLYDSEETNVMNISKVIQAYNAYIFVFENTNRALDSFKNFTEFHDIVSVIVGLFGDIGENLRLYSLIFNDSVSRYYYSNIENNVSYLSKLLMAKDELTLYLSITKGLGVLNDYHLYNLIKYIEENDYIKGISDKFKYFYFKNLIDKYLLNREFLLDENNFYDILKKTIALEDLICKQKGRIFINGIIQNNEIDYRKKKVKHFDYVDFFRQNKKRLKVYLATNNFVSIYSKIIDFDVIIIDDAHMIDSGKYNDIFKGKQIIIAGDYQSNKIVNQNLISLAFNFETITLKERYELGPRHLTNNIYSIKSPYNVTYKNNVGVKVIEKGINDYIYNLYIDDCNVKINFFIKSISAKREIFESLAKSFYRKNVSSENVINFLNNNMYITDISNRNYVKSDYNIIYLKDYCYEDSQIAASNLLEILILARKELIIYDTESLLLKDIEFDFFKMVKNLIILEDVFVGTSYDSLTESITNRLSCLGYKVYFPGNQVSFIVQKPDSDELISVFILFNNGYVFDMISNYRSIYEQYVVTGHKVIFRMVTKLLEGEEKFINDLVEEINA